MYSLLAKCDQLVYVGYKTPDAYIEAIAQNLSDQSIVVIPDFVSVDSDYRTSAKLINAAVSDQDLKTSFKNCNIGRFNGLASFEQLTSVYPKFKVLNSINTEAIGVNKLLNQLELDRNLINVLVLDVLGNETAVLESVYNSENKYLFDSIIIYTCSQHLIDGKYSFNSSDLFRIILESGYALVNVTHTDDLDVVKIELKKDSNYFKNILKQKELDAKMAEITTLKLANHELEISNKNLLDSMEELNNLKLAHDCLRIENNELQLRVSEFVTLQAKNLELEPLLNGANQQNLELMKELDNKNTLINEFKINIAKLNLALNECKLEHNELKNKLDQEEKYNHSLTSVVNNLEAQLLLLSKLISSDSFE